MLRHGSLLCVWAGTMLLGLVAPTSASSVELPASGTGLLPGEVRTIAGTGDEKAEPRDPGFALLEPVGLPTGMAVDPSGRLHYVDPLHHVVARIELDGRRVVVAGRYGVTGDAGDGGAATSGLLSSPYAIAFAPSGELYIADLGNNRIRRVKDGTLTTVAGNGQFAKSPDGGVATQTPIGPPLGVVVHPDGRVVFADSFTHRLRAVQADGTLDTVAGTGVAGLDDTEGAAAKDVALNFPFGLATDGTDLLVAETGNGRVRRILPDGTIRTVARSGRRDGSGDVGSGINGATAVAAGPQGDVYVADGSPTVWRVRDGEMAQAVAGTGTPGFSGDGGPATRAQVKSPLGLVVSGRDLVIADYGNSRLRRVSAVVPGPPPPAPVERRSGRTTKR